MASFTHKFSPLTPSNLRIASGPLLPASPLTPPYSRRVSVTVLVPVSPLKSTFPPPPQPLQWLWSCHLCHQRYPLGATRRCLQDGHLFCSGVAVSKRTGAIKKRVACASEFDYVGWKAWAEWRQDTQRYTPTTTGKKDCFHSCTYPSECRWGKKHGVESPTIKRKYVAYSPVPSPPAPSKTEKPRSSLFLDKLIKSAGRKSARSKGILSPVEEEEAHTSTSPSRTHDQLPDLQFPMLSLESKDDTQLSEDALMSDSDSDSEDGSHASIDASLHDAPHSERPKFSPDSMQSEETTTVERIIEYATADISFSVTEPSPTSPGRRNAWDWSMDVPDSVVLSEDFPGQEQVVWEKENFFDVEMS